MTKLLYVRYGDLEICKDLEVDEFSFQESEGYIALSGKSKPAKAAPTAGLLDMLTQASRRKTDTKRAELTAEPTEESL